MRKRKVGAMMKKSKPRTIAATEKALILKRAQKFFSKSTVTESDAVKIGRIIKKRVLKKYLQQDKQFLRLIQDIRQESKKASYTQKDVDQAVAQVRKEAKRRS